MFVLVLSSVRRPTTVASLKWIPTRMKIWIDSRQRGEEKPSLSLPPHLRIDGARFSRAFSRITISPWCSYFKVHCGPKLDLMTPLRFPVINRDRRARLIFFAGVLLLPFSPLPRLCRWFYDGVVHLSKTILTWLPYSPGPFLLINVVAKFCKARYEIHPFRPSRPLLVLDTPFTRSCVCNI